MAYPYLYLSGDVKAGVSPGSKESHAPRVLTAPFGDGYVQRSGDGHNADVTKYEVNFTNLTYREVEAILEFFGNLKGYLPFYWTRPGAAKVQTWICPKWDKTNVDKTISSVSASFEEVFDA
jgi:phage-related protein